MTPEQAAAVQELVQHISKTRGVWSALTVGEFNALQLAVLVEQIRSNPEIAPRVLALLRTYQALNAASPGAAWPLYLEHLNAPETSRSTT